MKKNGNKKIRQQGKKDAKRFDNNIKWNWYWKDS